jgi:hypothetical protein
MRWIKDLYYLNRLRKLQKKEDEKSHEVAILRGTINDLNYDILSQYKRDKPNTKPNICEILDDDTPSIVNLKMKILLESERLKISDIELHSIRVKIFDCKLKLGVKG